MSRDNGRVSATQAGLRSDLPNFFVHFTGRPRHYQERLPPEVPATAEERMIQILRGGQLRAHPSFSSPPVVCVSEASRVVAGEMVTNWISNRGPYEKWGVLLRRPIAIGRGFRPVLHVSRDERQRLESSPLLTDELEGRFITYE